jgi:hypothetical protein
MSIWSESRLKWEIENGPFSYFKKFKEEHESRLKEAKTTEDTEALELAKDAIVSIPARYVCWNSDNNMPMELDGRLVNRYGDGQFVFRCDFALPTPATKTYAMLFGLDVVFVPFFESEFCLLDVRSFRGIFEWMTSNVPENEKSSLPEQLEKELRAYQRYLSFEGYDTE